MRLGFLGTSVSSGGSTCEALFVSSGNVRGILHNTCPTSFNGVVCEKYTDTETLAAATRLHLKKLKEMMEKIQSSCKPCESVLQNSDILADKITYINSDLNRISQLNEQSNKLQGAMNQREKNALWVSRVQLFSMYSEVFLSSLKTALQNDHLENILSEGLHDQKRTRSERITPFMLHTLSVIGSWLVLNVLHDLTRSMLDNLYDYRNGDVLEGVGKNTSGFQDARYTTTNIIMPILTQAFYETFFAKGIYTEKVTQNIYNCLDYVLEKLSRGHLTSKDATQLIQASELNEEEKQTLLKEIQESNHPKIPSVFDYCLDFLQKKMSGLFKICQRRYRYAQQ